MFFKFSRLITISACLLFLLAAIFDQYALAEEKATPAPETVDMSVTVGLFTKHVNPGNDTNEKTNFIGLSYDKYSISRFKNSYNDETWFGGLNFHTAKKNIFKDSGFYLQGNLYAGLVYGYEDHLPNLGGISPFLLPSIGLGYKWVCLEAVYIPTPSGGVFSSSLRFDLSFPKASGRPDPHSK